MKRAFFFLAGGVLFLGAAQAGAQPAPTVPVSTNNVVVPGINSSMEKSPTMWDTIKSLQFRPINLPKLTDESAVPAPTVGDDEAPYVLVRPEPKKKSDADWLVNGVEAKIKEQKDRDAAKTPAQIKALQDLDYQQMVEQSLGWKSPVRPETDASAEESEEETPTRAPNAAGAKPDRFGTGKTKDKLSLFSEYTTSGIEVTTMKKQSMAGAADSSKSDDPDALANLKPPTEADLSKYTLSQLTNMKTNPENSDFTSLDSLGKPNTAPLSTLATVANSSNEDVLARQQKELLPPPPTNILEPLDSKPAIPVPAPKINREVYKPPSPFPKAGMVRPKVPDPNDILDKP